METNNRDCVFLNIPEPTHTDYDVFIKLKRTYLDICENDICAALILRILEGLTYHAIRVREDRRQEAQQNNNSFDEMAYEEKMWFGISVDGEFFSFRKHLYNTFSHNKITNSLARLERLGYIAVLLGEKRDQPKKYKLDIPVVQAALDKLALSIMQNKAFSDQNDAKTEHGNNYEISSVHQIWETGLPKMVNGSTKNGKLYKNLLEEEEKKESTPATFDTLQESDVRGKGAPAQEQPSPNGLSSAPEESLPQTAPDITETEEDNELKTTVQQIAALSLQLKTLRNERKRITEELGYDPTVTTVTEGRGLKKPPKPNQLKWVEQHTLAQLHLMEMDRQIILLDAERKTAGRKKRALEREAGVLDSAYDNTASLPYQAHLDKLADVFKLSRTPDGKLMNSEHESLSFYRKCAKEIYEWRDEQGDPAPVSIVKDLYDYCANAFDDFGPAALVKHLPDVWGKLKKQQEDGIEIDEYGRKMRTGVSGHAESFVDKMIAYKQKQRQQKTPPAAS